MKIPPKGTKVLVRRNEAHEWRERISAGWFDCGDPTQSPGLVCYANSVACADPLDEENTFIWQDWREIEDGNI